jgi:arylsulfatase
MVDRMDQNIGRILANLRQDGEFQNTLIVFLSDNGACAEWDPFGFDVKSSSNNILHRGSELEGMGSPGHYHSVGSGWANASNTPWRLHKHHNHEGGINSPCIIHWPAGETRSGNIDDQPSHIIDLMPTLVEAAGAAYQGKLPLPGMSLVPLMRQGTRQERTLFFEHEGNRAVHAGNWKLVALREEPWELYNVATDRAELKNVAKLKPDLVEKLASQWNRWAEENQVTPFPEDYGVDYLRRPGTR